MTMITTVCTTSTADLFVGKARISWQQNYHHKTVIELKSGKQVGH